MHAASDSGFLFSFWFKSFSSSICNSRCVHFESEHLFFRERKFHVLNIATTNTQILTGCGNQHAHIPWPVKLILE